MPYVVRCRYCNQYFFGVIRRFLEETIIEHICDKHSESLIDFYIIRISDSLYPDYLENRDNPAFWQALRLCRKPEKNPFLFERA